MKKKISLLLMAIGLLMIGIGIGGCVSENISSTASTRTDDKREIRLLNYDLTEVVDPETGVHYLLYDSGGGRGGTAITVMYDSDGRIKHDK